MDNREQLRQRFNCAFADWGIELPADAVSLGLVCLIVQRGWTIWTRFDIATEDDRECLDYYAMHRMTNDRHGRLYADGEGEYLPAMEAHYIQGATVEEEKAARHKFFAYNQAVDKLLEEKGFVMTDQAHTRARISRYLLITRTRKVSAERVP